MERTYLTRVVSHLLGVACPVVVDRCSLPARFASQMLGVACPLVVGSYPLRAKALSLTHLRAYLARCRSHFLSERACLARFASQVSAVACPASRGQLVSPSQSAEIDTSACLPGTVVVTNALSCLPGCRGPLPSLTPSLHLPTPRAH